MNVDENLTEVSNTEKQGLFHYSYDSDKDPEPPNLTLEQRALCVGQHNQFPVNRPHFREVLEEYMKQMIILARRLMRTFALGLGAEEIYFDSTVTAPYASALLNYYPPKAPGGEDPDSLVAHSDFESKFSSRPWMRCILLTIKSVHNPQPRYARGTGSAE
jgi:isopenicillin N synthase-like dioxygenase